MQSQGQPYNNNNKVWKEFLKTFFVKRFINNQQLDTKSALAIYLEPLKRMAEPEEWGTKDLMLVNYFVHTFYALRHAQKKEPHLRYIVEYQNRIHFNTGLINTNSQSIYACFNINTAPGTKGTETNPQYSIGGDNATNFFLDVHMSSHCNPLPIRCKYFNDYTQLIMDGTKAPAVSWMHIIEENWDRLCNVLFPGQNTNDPGFKLANQYDVEIRLEGALKRALNRVHANYRTAIPYFFKGELQLLLPLCVRQPNKADLVLTISRTELTPPVPGEFTYTARTILTLEMAYHNARLIARPENDWLLVPSTIPEQSDDENN